MEKMIWLDIIFTNGQVFSFRSSLESKVAESKDLLAKISGVSTDHQTLKYKGEILNDDRTLASYGLRNYSVFHCQVPLNPLFDYPGTGGGMPDSSLQTLLSNPQLMELLQIVAQNTQVHSMFQASESQELRRQNSIRHSIPSDDAAAGPSTSFNDMGLIALMKYQISAALILAGTIAAWKICKS